MIEKSTERSVIKNKSNNEELGNVPELRFPEFNENWKKFTLSELGDFKNGVNKSKNDFGIGNPFVNLEDIFENRFLKSKNFNLVKVSEKELKEYNLKKGDVLFVRSSVKPEGVGLTSVLLENLDNTVYSGFIIRFRSNEKINVCFKQFCFSTFPIRKQILAKCSTSANTNINQESLKKININIPNLNEQNKIADFLSAIDSKIALMEKKYNCLIKTRKYFLNSLFCYNEEVGTVPELRFPGFSAEWDLINLKDICLINPKTTIPDKFKYIDLESVNSGILTQTREITREEAPSRAQRKLNKEDILFATVRPYQQNNYYFNLEGDYVASTGYAQIRPKENSQYLYYFLHTQPFLVEVLKRCIGTSYPAVNSNDLKTIKIKKPSIKEQEKIAKLFFSLDSKIELLEREIEIQKDFKKVLLCKMFC